MECAFKDSLSQLKIDIAALGDDMKTYCKNRFPDCHESFAVSTVDELLKSIRRLPYHNIFNVEVLSYLANWLHIDYLIELVDQYKSTFFSKSISELLKIANTTKIRITIDEDNSFTIKSLDVSRTKLEGDVTINELSGFIIEYSNAILHLKSGVCQPTCIGKGCVCIEWAIPAQLANYAFHSVCLSIKHFQKFNLKYVSVGRYVAESIKGSLESKLNLRL